MVVEGGGRVVAGELLEVRVDLDAAKLLRLDERDELGRDDATQGGEVEERVVLETVRDLHRRHLAPQVPLAVEAEQLGIAESSGGPARIVERDDERCLAQVHAVLFRRHARKQPWEAPPGATRIPVRAVEVEGGELQHLGDTLYPLVVVACLRERSVIKRG